MTHDEMIAVIQAHKDGKQIQSSPYDFLTSWSDRSDPDWDFGAYEYHIKPEPMEIWVNVKSPKLTDGNVYPSREHAERCRTETERTVKFREVLDE